MLTNHGHDVATGSTFQQQVLQALEGARLYLAGTKMRGLAPAKGKSYRKPFEYGSFLFYFMH